MKRGRKPIPGPETICYCGRPSFIKSTGLCRACYERAYRERRKAEGNPVKKVLSYKDCELCGQDKIWCRGMCSKCYWAVYRAERVERDGPRRTWPGNAWKSKRKGEQDGKEA